MVRAVGTCLRACAADGSVRPGLAPQDVLLLMGFLWRVGADTRGRDRGHRVTDLVVNGLCPPGTWPVLDRPRLVCACPDAGVGSWSWSR